MSGNLLHRKIVFLYHKNIDLGKSQICILPKGLVHSSDQHFDIYIFLLSIFSQNRSKNMCGNLLHRKIAILDHKNIDLGKSQNIFFPKGLVHGFGQNFDIIFTFCF